MADRDLCGLVSMVASYCFEVEIRAEFPGRVAIPMSEIVGNVLSEIVMYLVAKLKIVKFFSWCVCW